MTLVPLYKKLIPRVRSMNRISKILLLLAFVELSCTSTNSEEGNQVEIDQLKAENDSLKRTLDMHDNDVTLEINMVVSDAKEAADYYTKVLGAQIISRTDNEAGMNETIMSIGGVEIRVLDENKELGMSAPTEVGGGSIGINLFVEDIDQFFDNAIKEGCKVLSPITEFPDIPAKNAVFSDKFNHQWVVNQQF